MAILLKYNEFHRILTGTSSEFSQVFISFYIDFIVLSRSFSILCILRFICLFNKRKMIKSTATERNLDIMINHMWLQRKKTVKFYLFFLPPWKDRKGLRNLFYLIDFVVVYFFKINSFLSKFFLSLTEYLT